MLFSMQMYIEGLRDGRAAGLQELYGDLDLEGGPTGSNNEHYLEGFKAGFLRGLDSTKK